MRTKRILYRLCAAVLMLAILVSTALAAEKTIAEQMAENSAAWWIAHAAGDKELCDKLHKANEELAKQAAGDGGTASYAKDGTWTITDSQGNKTSSVSEENGKSNTVTYATTSSGGQVSSYSTTTFAEDSIQAMIQAGGTNDTLQTGYNNAAAQATAEDAYGDRNRKTSAAEEISVVKQLLGLSTEEATALQRELEVQKQAYASAQDQYKAAVARGDTAAAAAAKQRMDNAHNAAQEARAKYNYSADQEEANDGGYFNGDGTQPAAGGDGGGFRFLPLTCSITVTCGAGGSVSPAPVNGTITVSYGGDQRVEFKPNTGYRVKSVTVDGASQGTVSEYTFRQITSAHQLKVEFEKQKYDITASASVGGSISPSGTQSVEYGGSKTFTVTPNAGYEVLAVYVDGINQGKISAYTFSNITSTHSIRAEFRLKSRLELGSPVFTDASGTNLTGTAIKSGYGIYVSCPVTAVNVTGVQLVLSYNFGAGAKQVTLTEVSTGSYALPVNSSSATGARCVYIPVGIKDGKYTLTLTLSGLDADGKPITSSSSATITVKGSMYEDDFTGDR